MTNAFFTTTAVPLTELPVAAKFAVAYKAKHNKEPEAIKIIQSSALSIRQCWNLRIYASG